MDLETNDGQHTGAAALLLFLAEPPALLRLLRYNADR